MSDDWMMRWVVRVTPPYWRPLVEILVAVVAVFLFGYLLGSRS